MTVVRVIYVLLVVVSGRQLIIRLYLLNIFTKKCVCSIL
jgi:hypothetical protein